MTREEAINKVQGYLTDYLPFEDLEELEEIIKALEKEPILDKIDEIITDALDKSTDQKESQTLRWVLDKISELI